MPAWYFWLLLLIYHPVTTWVTIGIERLRELQRQKTKWSNIILNNVIRFNYIKLLGHSHAFVHLFKSTNLQMSLFSGLGAETKTLFWLDRSSTTELYP